LRNIHGIKKAVVLLSGGIDSATTLFVARERGYKCFPLSFDYGQRHTRELRSARRIAKEAGYNTRIVKISMPWKGSSLTDKSKPLPKGKGTRKASRIPSTYVPARNMIFLSIAAGYAESIGASRIFIGANSVDYSGYPDCRGPFIKALEHALKKGTKTGVESRAIKIEAPLLRMKKRDIIRKGMQLKVPYKYTWSCYAGESRPCKRCDSCIIRRNGFKKAGIRDEC